MKTILVCKSGTVFRPRSNTKQNARGEQGETEGLLRRLIARGDCNVVYFGRYDGEEKIPHVIVEPSLDYVRPHLHYPATCPPEAQELGFEEDLENLRAVEDDGIVGLINMMGYAATLSTIRNPKNAICQAAGINYVAPMLSALQKLQIPRLCIVTDPRCYPRDQEMSFGWGWTRPRALLDQTTRNYARSKIVGGINYEIITRYGAPQSWGVLDTVTKPLYREPAKCVAHAHVDTGIRKSSWEPWESVLHDVPEGFEMWGEGWDSSPFADAPWIHGPCDASDVLSILSRGICCPVVEHTREFVTGKPYVVFAAGAIPLLYGRDQTDDSCYDRAEVFLPLTHWSRLGPGDSLRELSEKIMNDLSLQDQLRNRWAAVLQPDYQVLDELVDKLLNGSFRDDGEFGGYIAC